MKKEKKLASVTIKVPYKGAGNITLQKDVEFDVFKDGEGYIAAPLLNANELRIANLPPELVFKRLDGKIVSARGNKDDNMHVITDIVTALNEKEVQL